MRKIFHVGLNVVSLSILIILLAKLVRPMVIGVFGFFVLGIFTTLFPNSRRFSQGDFLRAFLESHRNLIVVVNFVLFMIALKLIRDKVNSWENIPIIIIGFGATFGYLLKHPSLLNFFTWTLPMLTQIVVGFVFLYYFLIYKGEREPLGWYLLSLFVILAGSIICISAHIVKKGFKYCLLGLSFDDSGRNR